MIETLKDLKHGKTNHQYDNLAMERPSKEKLQDTEDSLESTRVRVLGE